MSTAENDIWLENLADKLMAIPGVLMEDLVAFQEYIDGGDWDKAEELVLGLEKAYEAAWQARWDEIMPEDGYGPDDI